MNAVDDTAWPHIETLYRQHRRYVLATLIRLLGDFDVAEDALHEAFHAALKQWPHDGVPNNPRAWLVSAGRFKAIDRLRRRARFDADLSEHTPALEMGAGDPAAVDDEGIADDQLRLVFTCCHPALSPEAQIALTLRTVCGLTTEEIARAFLLPAPTVAQRIVRAKAKIRDARIPYEVPSAAEHTERLDAVLKVIYLTFNEGYSATSGSTAVRIDLANEAIRLGELLAGLLPEPEALGLLALMLLQISRRHARVSDGELVMLEDQDRTLWDTSQIKRGCTLVEHALAAPRAGPYAIQAAIAAVHAEAPTHEATDWRQIVGLYDVLLRMTASPVVELNRAVAVAMCDGAEMGLVSVEAILARGELRDYFPAHAARAALCRRAGRINESCTAYKRALELAQQEPERRYLARRLADVIARHCETLTWSQSPDMGTGF